MGRLVIWATIVYISYTIYLYIYTVFKYTNIYNQSNVWNVHEIITKCYQYRLIA